MVTYIKCPFCGAQVALDNQIHILDDVERTDYCDVCEQIIVIVNRNVSM